MHEPYKAEGEMYNWERNAYLLNQGLKAVSDIASKTHFPIQRFLHVAQPENALWWFKQAIENGITDFDWIGLSYYPKWSSYKLDKLSVALDSLK